MEDPVALARAGDPEIPRDRVGEGVQEVDRPRLVPGQLFDRHHALLEVVPLGLVPVALGDRDLQRLQLPGEDRDLPLELLPLTRQPPRVADDEHDRSEGQDPEQHAKIEGRQRKRRK